MEASQHDWRDVGTESGTKTTDRPRLDGLDAVKLAAAALVVLEHSVLRGTGRDLVAYVIYGACHVAVPTFFAVAGYIAGLKQPAGAAVASFAATRAKRLLVPALFWMAFFPAFTFARTGSAPWGEAVTAEWLVASFAGGGYAWFLVVLFCIAVLGALLDRRTQRIWPTYAGLALFTLLGLVQPVHPVGLGGGTFYFFIPVYGAVYWAAMRFSRTAWRPPTGVAAAALISLSFGAGGLAVVRQLTGLQAYSWLMYVSASLGALGALALAVDPSIRWNRILRPLAWVSEGTLGIYLVHVVLIGYVFLLVPPMQPLLRTFVGAIATFFVTAVFVAVARRWGPARAVL